MRFFVRVLWDIERGNELSRNGTMGSTVGSILEKVKPEAAYFPADGGSRSAFLVVELDDASQMPGVAEPWFLALNATVEFQPIMVADDLEKAGPAIQEAVENYG